MSAGTDLRHAQWDGPAIGPTGAPYQSKTFSPQKWGNQNFRTVSVVRPGFWLQLDPTLPAGSHTYGLQGIEDNRWSGQDLSSYGLCTGSPNTGSWRRFLTMEFTMTCSPDPSGATATPYYGSGTSKTHFKATVNQWQPLRTVVDDSIVSGSGQDARKVSLPFSTYVISDVLSVDINTDTSCQFTQIIKLGYVDPSDGSHVPGTIYTITLLGQWYNGILPSAVFAAAWALYQTYTPFIYGGIVGGTPHLTLDNSGNPAEYNVTTAPGGICFANSSAGMLGNSLWFSGPSQPSAYYGYSTSSPGSLEAHVFASCDYMISGAWNLAVDVLNFRGEVVSSSSSAGPTLWLPDRYMGEPLGTTQRFCPTGAGVQALYFPGGNFPDL